MYFVGLLLISFLSSARFVYVLLGFLIAFFWSFSCFVEVSLFLSCCCTLSSSSCSVSSPVLLEVDGLRLFSLLIFLSLGSVFSLFCDFWGSGWNVWRCLSIGSIWAGVGSISVCCCSSGFFIICEVLCVDCVFVCAARLKRHCCVVCPFLLHMLQFSVSSDRNSL